MALQNILLWNLFASYKEAKVTGIARFLFANQYLCYENISTPICSYNQPFTQKPDHNSCC